jgi:hypothetical protein
VVLTTSGLKVEGLVFAAIPHHTTGKGAWTGINKPEIRWGLCGRKHFVAGTNNEVKGGRLTLGERLGSGWTGSTSLLFFLDACATEAAVRG